MSSVQHTHSVYVPSIIFETSITTTASMGFDMNDPSNFPLAVFICICGAAGGLLLGWAFFHYLRPADEEDPFSVPNDQASYMREVRQRNKQSLADSYGRPRYYMTENNY